MRDIVMGDFEDEIAEEMLVCGDLEYEPTDDMISTDTDIEDLGLSRGSTRVFLRRSYNILSDYLNNMSSFKKEYKDNDSCLLAAHREEMFNADIEITEKLIKTGIIDDYIDKIIDDEVLLHIKLINFPLSDNAVNTLNRNGFYCIDDFFIKNVDVKRPELIGELMKGVLDILSIKGFFSSAKVEKLKKKCVKLFTPGKRKCMELRKIRTHFAEVNGIPFYSTECLKNEECIGTCPKCDEEIEYLNYQIKKIEAEGKHVVFRDLTIAEISKFLSEVSKK